MSIGLTKEQMDALPVGSKVKDRHGDIWTKGTAVWTTPETAPFLSMVLVTKWAPLTLVEEG